MKDQNGNKIYKWKFILKDEELYEGKNYIEAWFTDEEIKKMKEENPEIRWSA